MYVYTHTHTHTHTHTPEYYSAIKKNEIMPFAAREKQHITYKGIPIRLTADLSAETLQASREWQDIFKVMKGKKIHY